MQREMTRDPDSDRATQLRLPPDRRDWVLADHRVHFVIAALELIDAPTAPVNARDTGRELRADRAYPARLGPRRQRPKPPERPTDCGGGLGDRNDPDVSPASRALEWRSGKPGWRFWAALRPGPADTPAAAAVTKNHGHYPSAGPERPNSTGTGPNQPYALLPAADDCRPRRLQP